MSDLRFRRTLRTAIAEPSPENITFLRQEALRTGILQPLNERRGRRFSYLACQAYLAAERILANSLPFDSHFRQWGVARREYSVRRLLAQCVIGGLDAASLQILLNEAGLDMPIVTWSPGGEGFDEITRPLDYASSTGNEYTEFYITYLDARNSQLDVTLVDCVVDISRVAHRPERRYDVEWEYAIHNYQTSVHRGFTAEDVSLEDRLVMSEEMEIDMEEIIAGLQTPTGLAQAAFWYHHQYGAQDMDTTPLYFHSPQEVERHFGLEIAMIARKMLR